MGDSASSCNTLLLPSLSSLLPKLPQAPLMYIHFIFIQFAKKNIQTRLVAELRKFNMFQSRVDDGHANHSSYVIKECPNITEQGRKTQLPLRTESESL